MTDSLIFDRLYRRVTLERPMEIRLSFDEWCELRADPRTRHEIAGMPPDYTFRGVPLVLPR